jgi:creatinine amidohydrolase
MLPRTLVTAAFALALVANSAPCAARQDVLEDTIAELTWNELEARARSGAIALWAIGAIEEHGPHLPLATDIYLPTSQLRLVRSMLGKRGVKAEIVPPYFWGVNHVTGAFPGSIEIRPDTMRALMGDVFQSLRKAGFQQIVVITGHYDAAHSRTILEAVEAANAQGIKVTYLVPQTIAARIGVVGPRTGAIPVDLGSKPGPVADLHAGDAETSAMLSVAPSTVRTLRLRSLPPTNLSEAQVAEWRRGQEHARRLTPDGYVGDPARATAAKGRRLTHRTATAYTNAIFGLVNRTAGREPAK